MSINSINQIDLIQGNVVEFLDLHMAFNDNVAFLKAKIISNGIMLSLECSNIAHLKIETQSNHFVVQGLEIIDKTICGWQKENRYYIHDFEDNLLDIYCEDISIFMLE